MRRSNEGIKTLLAAGLLAALSGVPAYAEITVATAGPMTGQYASFGQQMKAGAEMAVADINAKGGVLGEMLNLEVGDDACDPGQAVAVAMRWSARGGLYEVLLLWFLHSSL